jgi:hypothetical protein
VSGAVELAREIVKRERGISTISAAYGRVIAVVGGANEDQKFLVEFKSGEREHCSIAQSLQDYMEAIAGVRANPVGREVVVLTDLTPPFVVDLVARRGTLYAELG